MNTNMYLAAPLNIENFVPVFVETERFYDARAFAARILGVPEVSIAAVQAQFTMKRKEYYQVKWAGTAAGLNDLHMVFRHFNGKKFSEWKDVRYA